MFLDYLLFLVLQRAVGDPTVCERLLFVVLEESHGSFYALEESV